MSTSSPALCAREFVEAAEIAGECYYEHSVERGAARPVLAGDLAVDVGIIGGGFAGLSAALELSMRGSTVAVLEADRIASAASGRNGGQILPGFSCDIGVLVSELGQADARQAWDLSIEGMSIVKERASMVGVNCDYSPGWLLFAARAGHVKKLREWYTSLVCDYGYGEHVRFIESAQVSDWTSSKSYHAALVDRYAGHLNPLKLALAMGREIEAKGGRIFEHSRVEHIARGDRPVLETAQGRLHCAQVVSAANVFVGGLDLPIRNRVMSVGNSIIATEPLPVSLAESLVRDRYAACDSNFLLDYYRVTPDNRVLWGGGATYLKHDAANRIETLRRKMCEVYPQLEGARIEYAWGGLIDVTLSRAPDFGTIDDHIFYLQGFSGHGLNVTAIAGRLVAEAISGDRTRFDLLARIRHRQFPGGKWLKRLGLGLGASYYQLRDLLA
ncbi:MAG: FAD-binding oxidoreductase [Burkholderiaceae bacterium]|jgi:gamma-glutamylputrescine oxidase